MDEPPAVEAPVVEAPVFSAPVDEPPVTEPPVFGVPAPEPISPYLGVPRTPTGYDLPALEALLAGPERIESGWWDGEAADVCRDYFVARRPDHSLVWVFRERRAPHGWFLHGYFA